MAGGYDGDMRVLLVNDDGPLSATLSPLAAALERAGAEVRIWIPASDRSARGKASIYGRVGISEATLSGRAAMLVGGYPADAVQCGLSLDGDFDQVFSGVNDCPNLGCGPILTSGTVGAVLEAALGGVPGVAVSAHPRTDPETAAAEAVRWLGEEGAWNVNVPPAPSGRVIAPLRKPPPRGLRVRSWIGEGAELSQLYLDWGNPGDLDLNDDAAWFAKGCVTATPLTADLTDRSPAIAWGRGAVPDASSRFLD